MSQNLPRVVELIRVSTDGQKEKATHEAQRASLDEMRKSRPGVVIERIEALGVSGAKGLAERGDLQLLLKLSKEKAYDELRFFSFDRLTRSADMREQAAIFMAVKEANAVFVDVNQQVIDPASGLGQLYFTMLTTFAAQERSKIVERTVAGKKLKASQGKMVHGTAPYGRRFNKTTQAWELVPEEVEVYQRIIDAYLKGSTMLEIARALNAECVPSKRTKWGVNTINRLLTAPTIVGTYKAFGHVMQIPPIVTKAEYERIRATIAQKVTRKKDTHAIDALIRGHGHCAACGLPLWVLTTGAHRGQSRYGCPKPSKRATPCPDRRTIAVKDADAYVSESLLNMVRRPEVFERALSDCNPVTDAKATLKAIEKELGKLSTREARTLKLFNEGFLSEDLAKSELGAIQAAKKAALEKKSTVRAAAPTVPVEDLQALRAELAEAVKNATPQRIKELIAILRPTIALGPNGLEINGELQLGYESRPR
jgi:DNA invertase Pin-like site-specific DNA recombinase